MTTAWVERRCPLCGAQDEGRVFAESNIDLERLNEFAFASRKLPEYMHPRLLECRRCGMLYGNPVLSADTLASAYREAAFDSGEEAGYASATYGELIRRLPHRLPDRDGALDIGTGDGAFLERLLDFGFTNVRGVEPSTAPIAAAKPAIRPLIRHGVFQGDDYAPESLSLMTCFQVMEHVWDPAAICTAALRLLKPGGVFVVVVHNREALSAKVLGIKSPIFDIEHLQLFCPATARGLLERSGFENVRVAPVWNRYPLRYWMRLFPFPAGMKPGLIQAAQWTGVDRVMVPLPAGNIVVSGEKPPG